MSGTARCALRELAALVLVLMLWAGCGGGTEERPAVEPSDWGAVEEAARGQTVRWWMYGGDERVNRYVDEHVAPALAERGVALERVPVSDTADAVQRVLAEKQAEKTAGGSVDTVWINGENFARGREAGLWLEDWARELPNARYVDWGDPTIARDFGVPVDGQESPWSRAVFAFAYDGSRTPDPPRTFEDLLAHARTHPGRVTYPAPPDFTGSAFVRLAVQALGEEPAFELLADMRPHQWRGGEAFPGSEAELNRLFGDGQVDFAMSYNPAFVLTGVLQGVFPESARPLVFQSGALQNVSYLTIPFNAGRPAGALLLADLLLEPRLQAVKADPRVLGAPSVVDLSRLDPDQRAAFSEHPDSPYLLDTYGELLEELPPERALQLERRWDREILR